MGIIKKLLGVGAVAGATVAAVRVSDKYKENNPDGVQDVNGDGKVDAKDKFEAVKQAAKDAYDEAAAKVNANARQNGPAAAEQPTDTTNG